MRVSFRFAASIKPNQVRLALTGLKTTRNFNRASLVIPGWPDAHPMPSRPRKFDHIRSTIFPRELVPQFIRSALILERANLHAPAPSVVKRRRSSKYFHPHPGHARPPHADRLRGCQRKIEHAIGNKRPTIGNTQDHRLSSRKICHPDQRIHGQRAVCSGQRILVEDLAVSPAPLVIWRPVPAGRSLFAVDDWVRCNERSIRLVISDRIAEWSATVPGSKLKLRMDQAELEPEESAQAAEQPPPVQVCAGILYLKPSPRLPISIVAARAAVGSATPP